MSRDLSSYKQDITLLKNNPELVYLDYAATSLTPDTVIEAMNTYYTMYRANIHRSGHSLATAATAAYEQARNQLSLFIGAPSSTHVLFTSGATHGLNIVAEGIKKSICSGDIILLSRLEHHANLLPWQRIAKETGAELGFIDITDNYEIDMQSYRTYLASGRVKIVSVAHISHVFGTKLPVDILCKEAKQVGAYTIVDGAQSLPHVPVDVSAMGCDAFVASAHKCYGPTGIGLLYVSDRLASVLSPYHLGGGMIANATFLDATWAALPFKFEAGTPNIAGAIGFGSAAAYVDSIGMVTIAEHLAALTKYAISQLSAIPEFTHIGSVAHSYGIISFIIEGIHPFDIATILDQHHVAIRAGHHCAEPLMTYLALPGTCRISLGLYTTTQDIDVCVSAIKKAIVMLKRT